MRFRLLGSGRFGIYRAGDVGCANCNTICGLRNVQVFLWPVF